MLFLDNALETVNHIPVIVCLVALVTGLVMFVLSLGDDL
jgi:hypothetical protein